MDFEDFGAKGSRKVRIETIFARKIAIGVISGPVRGVGGSWNLSMVKSRANVWQIYGKCMAKSMRIPRLSSEAKSGKSLKIVENR